jgi:hypothetical protein
MAGKHEGRILLRRPSDRRENKAYIDLTQIGSNDTD